MEDKIIGRFTIVSDQQGSFYHITFKPDVDQVWSASPKGFAKRFDNLDAAEALVGPHAGPHFRDARLNGKCSFAGSIDRTEYARHGTFAAALD